MKIQFIANNYRKPGSVNIDRTVSIVIIRVIDYKATQQNLGINKIAWHCVFNARVSMAKLLTLQ